MVLDFVAWEKTPRLYKDIVVTEKIDGTNAAVVIEAIKDPRPDLEVEPRQKFGGTWLGKGGAGTYDARVFRRGEGPNARLILVGAQSRNRLITPESDNAGFARWTFDNSEQLLEILGVGRHYGEWWGSGIQRGYGLTKGEKRFSLFNVSKYGSMVEVDGVHQLVGLDVVPTLYQGPFSESAIEDAMQHLDEHGSVASPGFLAPEGVIVYHTAGKQVYKWTFEDAAKGDSQFTETDFVEVSRPTEARLDKFSEYMEASEALGDLT